MALSDGLVGYWSPWLGSSGYRLLDRTRYANHGTLTNMDAGTDWLGGTVLGKSGTYLDFDGSNDYVVTTYKITKTPITMYSFVYTRSLGTTANRPGIVFMRPTATGINASYFNPARVGYTWNDQQSNWNGGPLWPLTKNALIAVTITSTVATAYAISEDGFASGSNTVTHGALTSNANVEIGRDNFQNNANRHFDGRIYEAGIFERPLAATELLQLYRIGPGWYRPYAKRSIGYPIAAGFKAYWHRRQQQIIGGGLR